MSTSGGWIFQLLGMRLINQLLKLSKVYVSREHIKRINFQILNFQRYSSQNWYARECACVHISSCPTFKIKTHLSLTPPQVLQWSASFGVKTSRGLNKEQTALMINQVIINPQSFLSFLVLYTFLLKGKHCVINRVFQTTESVICQ